MLNIRVGHYTCLDKKTGISVFLFESEAIAVYHLCGAAPASRELHVLEPTATVPGIHGLCFAGGSAFGLNATAGVMNFLKEQGKGFQTPHTTIPIVPAAAIYDCAISQAPPTAEDAYQACRAAIPENPMRGAIGAGRSATVGKMVAGTEPSPGGFGWHTVTLPHGIIVTAYAVVNCLGDVRNQQGDIIAGARSKDQTFTDTEKFLLHNPYANTASALNTTLVAVMTNARFSKAELSRIARVASTGMARAISPVFTRYDGDLIFCVTTNEVPAHENNVSVAAAEAVRLAIIDAVSA
ncbi:MAG: P1 family peptidase [Gammaproteobacteria bacterium]|nr:P1 family peptidase [Gammaproteobacteria bacterium]